MTNLLEKLNLTETGGVLDSRISSDHTLLKQYIEICNEAIATNRDVFPYREIFKALEGRDLSKVSVSIINDCPSEDFEVCMKQGRDGNELACSCAQSNCAANNDLTKQWRVAKSYLQKVVEDPTPYIQNPALIDWEWLLSSPKDSLSD